MVDNSEKFDWDAREREREDLERETKQVLQERKNDLETVLSTEQGRRFVWSLMSESGVFCSTYNPKAADVAIDVAFAEGRKQLGYRLLEEIQVLCPHKFLLMQQEMIKKWQKA